MRPAFSSTKQAAAFALLLLAMLLLPAIGARLGVPSRDEAYATMPVLPGPFSFMRHEIFEEKSDVDIVFVGASCVFFGIDTPSVQRELSARLGREARVITLAGLWAAEDRNYLILRDLLQHREVKMVVFNMEEECSHYYEEPYAYAYRFFQMDEDTKVLAGLPFKDQAAFYGEAVLGMPRHLLSLAIPPLLENSPEARDLGMRHRPFGYKGDGSTFVAFTPVPPVVPPQEMIYSPGTQQNFHFGNQPMDEFQAHFLKKIGQLLRDHGIPLVVLDLPPKWRNPNWSAVHREEHLPADFIEPKIRAATVEEYADWSGVFGVSASFVGVPPARLFDGLTDEQVELLYADRIHLNDNGSVFFTRVITPALLELYEKNTPR